MKQEQNRKNKNEAGTETKQKQNENKNETGTKTKQEQRRNERKFEYLVTHIEKILR